MDVLSPAPAQERVAHLEGRVVEQSKIFDDIRREMSDIRVELRQEMRDVRDSIRSMDNRMSRQFMWLVGIQVTSLLAVTAMFASLATR